MLDYELLAVLLQTGTKEEPILEFSKRILSEFTGLGDMINMSIEDWMNIKGIKESKACKMIAFLEFSKRIYQYKKDVIFLGNEKLVYEYIKYDLVCKTYEELIVLFVDTKCNLISKLKLGRGNINILYVDVKEIISAAVKYKATGIFLIHNHPSGDTTPSNSDIELTSNIKNALQYFDVNVLDHIIIGNNKYFSFNSNNII